MTMPGTTFARRQNVPRARVGASIDRPKKSSEDNGPLNFFLPRPHLAGVRVKGILKRGFQCKTPKKAPGKEDAMEVVKKCN